MQFIRINAFFAGSTGAHMEKWRTIASDKRILTAVFGFKIEFGSVLPIHFGAPRSTNMSELQTVSMDLRIEKFLEKRIITESAHEPDEFISNVFLREKKGGTYRMILNLKNLHTCMSLM